MLSKRSVKTRARVLSIALILSLVVSFSPGLMTGASQAAPLAAPGISGEAVTPFQAQLAEAINQRMAAGLPAPTVTFGIVDGNAENFKALVQPLEMKAVSEPSKSTAVTTLFFDGPAEAGYTVWPAVQVTGSLAGGEKKFATDDLTQLMRQVVEAQQPDFWTYATFGQEAREYTITETIELTPGSLPLDTQINSSNSLGGASAGGFARTATLEDEDDASLTTTEDILMGFTYTGPHIRYILEHRARSCIWLPFVGTVCIEWYYVKAGFELDWALGLRLPATVNMNRDTLTDTIIKTSLVPQDWEEEDYNNSGAAAEDGNEFVLRLDFWAGVLVRIAGFEICPIKPIPCYLDLSQDYSDSFVTPFGTGTSFNIPGIDIPLFEFSGAGVTANVFLNITPRLTSTKIQADWEMNKGPDCSETGKVIYQQPGEEKTFNTTKDCFTSEDNPNPIGVTLKNFRYYFNEFSLVFNAGISIDLWGLWSKTLTTKIFELNLSFITGAVDLYLPDHVQCNFYFVCGRKGPDNNLAFTTPPVITYSIEGTAGKNGWYRSDVSLTWEIYDDEPYEAEGCDPVSLTGEQEQTVFTCKAVSAGGEAQVDVLLGIDLSGPVITCSEDEAFLLNSGEHVVVPAEVDASLAGLDASAANVLTGSVTTEAVGPKFFTFSAFDLAGNAGEKTCSFAVHYNTSGFLPPVDEFNVGKAGRTYPVKWQLMDSGDLFISDLAAVVKIEVKASSACVAAEAIPGLLAAGGVQSSWRYDFTDNQFIYNWRTPTTPGCYALEVTLASGQVLRADFDLK